MCNSGQKLNNLYVQFRLDNIYTKNGSDWIVMNEKEDRDRK